MPKRPGSPLEPENNRKGPRFFAESRNKLENDIPPLGDQSSTIQHQGEPEGGNEEPSSPPPSSMNEQGSEQEPDLQQLLSVEGLNTREEIEARFHAIARQLFANYRIRIQPGNTKSESNSVAAGEADKNEKGPCVELQLMEIEFYLISPNVHEDPYCHGSLEQTRSGCWYVCVPSFMSLLLINTGTFIVPRSGQRLQHTRRPLVVNTVAGVVKDLILRLVLPFNQRRGRSRTSYGPTNLEEESYFVQFVSSQQEL